MFREFQKKKGEFGNFSSLSLLAEFVMSEFLRKYWFVCLLAVLFLGVLIYFIMDTTKDNVKTTKVDGEDVVVSTTIGDITSTALYDENTQNAGGLLYSLYRNNVVDQAVSSTSEMEQEAKTIAKNLKNNLKANPDSEDSIQTIQQLASLGFYGDSAVEDYARIVGKMRVLDREFVQDNISKLATYVPEGARLISVLTIQVEDTENLSEEETKLKEDIQKALDDKTAFEDIVAQYSTDTSTKDNDGFYGYIDSTTTTLDQEVVDAAVALGNGEVSDWISVLSTSGGYTLYRVKVLEVDPAKILENDNSTVVEALTDAIINNANGLEVLAVKQAAQKLDITFDSDELKQEVEEYINAQVETLEAELGLSSTTKDDSKTSSSTASSATSATTSASTSSAAASDASSQATSSETEGN